MLGSLEVRELGGRRSPRRLQEVPGRPPGDHQEDPRRRPGGPGRPLGGPWEALRIKIPPRSPRRPPGNRQEAAKKSPRCPREAPRRPQERRKKWPRGPQERPRTPPRESQRGTRREYNEKRDFDDPLEEIRGFSVVWAFQNGRKLAPKRAKKEENSTRDAKREQIEAKVRAKTRPEPQNRRQQAAKWPWHVLTLLLGGYYLAPVAAG